MCPFLSLAKSEVDPLTCPKCQGRMRIIAFIDDAEVIKKILKHLDLWDKKAGPPPLIKAYIRMTETRPILSFLCAKTIFTVILTT